MKKSLVRNLLLFILPRYRNCRRLTTVWLATPSRVMTILCCEVSRWRFLLTRTETFFMMTVWACTSVWSWRHRKVRSHCRSVRHPSLIFLRTDTQWFFLGPNFRWVIFI